MLSTVVAHAAACFMMCGLAAAGKPHDHGHSCERCEAAGSVRSVLQRGTLSTTEMASEEVPLPVLPPTMPDLENDLEDVKTVLRSCARGNQCGPGLPWPHRIHMDEGNWEEYVEIKWHFAKGEHNETLQKKFRNATKYVEKNTCIVLHETEPDAASKPYVQVLTTNRGCGVQDTLGYPGAHHNTTVGVGGCGSEGKMIHEIGHVIGMNHEHKRPDAEREIFGPNANGELVGHGPYLTIKWQNIPYGWRDQYDVDYSSYVGSADDGPGDPYVGWAPYDFKSIMHYEEHEGHDHFDPVPYGTKVGQRIEFSEGDLSQIHDMYQCKRTHKCICPWNNNNQFICFDGYEGQCAGDEECVKKNETFIHRPWQDAQEGCKESICVCTGDDNKYVCRHGYEGQCAPDEECYATKPFVYGQWHDGCRAN